MHMNSYVSNPCLAYKKMATVGGCGDRVTMIKSSKKNMLKLLSILVDVQDIYADKIYPNFYDLFYPEVPRWVCQR